ncbi:MAG TPA: hypothetical protein VFQ77_05995 [Pseudonocardiaceae bacterium]|nr:hypothetical protein [Pseudonocardiaceae bacterium]
MPRSCVAAGSAGQGEGLAWYGDSAYGTGELRGAIERAGRLPGAVGAGGDLPGRSADQRVDYDGFGEGAAGDELAEGDSGGVEGGVAPTLAGCLNAFGFAARAAAVTARDGWQAS